MDGQNFLTRYRGWIIFFIVVPVSFIYQKLQDLSNWYYRSFVNTNKHHQKTVAQICLDVKSAVASGKKLRTSRAPWKTMSLRKVDKSEYAQIQVNLRNVLNIDKDRMVVKVEPGATMGDITHYLIPRGFALAVQVEMDDLTVGGLCMGIGIETSSHRYGFLFESIESYEIVVPSGEVIEATKDNHSDLYHALPMSHGTLGFLTAVELKIVEVKPYMKVEYLPFSDLQLLCETLKDLTVNDKYEFVETLIYSEASGVIMVGEFADQVEQGKINPINRWYKPWFYTHVEQFLKNGSSVEYIPLRQYYHRHTSSIFFQLKDLIPFANQWWYRWLFGWAGAPKVSLMKYTMTRELRKRAMEKRVAQDIIIPIDDLEEAVRLAHSKYDIYPLWICPVRIYDKNPYEGIIRNPLGKLTGKKYAMFVDVGIYGIPSGVARGTWNGLEVSRHLENFTTEKGGFHMLYADIFMTRKEFEVMFSHEMYRKVRLKYEAEDAFPEIYDKVLPEKWLIDIEGEIINSDQPIAIE